MMSPLTCRAGRLGEMLVIFVLLAPSPARAWGPDTSLAEASASFWGELAGLAVTTACGDVNGDGLDDILVAYDQFTETELEAGKVYLILGRHTGWVPIWNCLDIIEEFVTQAYRVTIRLDAVVH